MLSFPQPFNYALLDNRQRAELETRMLRIQERRRRLMRDLIEEGLDLIEIKEMLPHGQFKRWLDSEYYASQRTAEYMMRIARAFQDFFGANRNCFDDLIIDQRALMVLSDPACPSEARREAIELAKERRVDEKIARTIMRLYSEGGPRPGDQRPVLSGSLEGQTVEINNRVGTVVEATTADGQRINLLWTEVEEPTPPAPKAQPQPPLPPELLISAIEILEQRVEIVEALVRQLVQQYRTGEAIAPTIEKLEQLL